MSKQYIMNCWCGKGAEVVTSKKFNITCMNGHSLSKEFSTKQKTINKWNHYVINNLRFKYGYCGRAVSKSL